MFQAALLETMNTALAPWRTAVSISMALMPKAPSPLTRDHLPVRAGERRRDGERHADAEAAEGAGVHVGRACEPDAGEAEKVAAVGDGDVVGIGHLPRWRRRWRADGSCRRRRSWRRFCAALSACARDGGGAVRRPRPCRCRARGCRPPPPSRRARGAGVASSSGSPRRLSISSPAIVGEADEAGVAGTPPASRSRAGSRACGRSRARRRPRSSRRRAWRRRSPDDRPARGRGFPGCRDRARRWRRGGGPAPAPALARAAAGDDERALRRPEHLDRLARPPPDRAADRVRGFALHPFVEHELRRHVRAQDVGRDLEIDRAGLARVAHGARHAPRRARGSPARRRAACATCARHRAQDVDVRDVLQRAHVGLRRARCSRRSAAPARARARHWPSR